MSTLQSTPALPSNIGPRVNPGLDAGDDDESELTRLSGSELSYSDREDEEDDVQEHMITAARSSPRPQVPSGDDPFVSNRNRLKRPNPYATDALESATSHHRRRFSIAPTANDEPDVDDDVEDVDAQSSSLSDLDLSSDEKEDMLNFDEVGGGQDEDKLPSSLLPSKTRIRPTLLSPSPVNGRKELNGMDGETPIRKSSGGALGTGGHRPSLMFPGSGLGSPTLLDEQGLDEGQLEDAEEDLEEEKAEDAKRKTTREEEQSIQEESDDDTRKKAREMRQALEKLEIAYASLREK